MVQLETIHTLLRYDDWANDVVFRAAAQLSDEQLDRPFDMGRGSLRRTLMHVVFAEDVWLARWRGERDTPWPDESGAIEVTAMVDRLGKVRAARGAFLATVEGGGLARPIVYRDSLGSLFSATLGDMMVQYCIHSAHHRAQIVNMLRRVGGEPPELDYMYWRRKPA